MKNRKIELTEREISIIRTLITEHSKSLFRLQPKLEEKIGKEGFKEYDKVVSRIIAKLN